MVRKLACMYRWVSSLFMHDTYRRGIPNQEAFQIDHAIILVLLLPQRVLGNDILCECGEVMPPVRLS